MTNSIPTLTLNNGVELPSLGFGVFQSSPEDTAQAVETALRTGYRHIDTAAIYGNEREVGEGLRNSGVPRDEVFLETKVWINDFGYDKTRHAFDKSAGKLGVDTIDLLILHQSLPSHFDLTLDAYRGLESLLKEGRVRAIGVSNFLPEHLDKLIEETEVVPAVNQVEIHPYFRNTETLEADAKHGVLSQAWSPIGGITFYSGWGENRTSTLDNPTLKEIGAKYGKTAAQIMLRWHIDEGRSAIPKSVHESRIKENFDVFDFSLTKDELTTIDTLDTGHRTGPAPTDITIEEYGADIPEA